MVTLLAHLDFLWRRVRTLRESLQTHDDVSSEEEGEDDGTQGTDGTVNTAQPGGPNRADGVTRKPGMPTFSNVKNTFYVYCKTDCHDVCPGQIRVRCAGCKSNEVTLHKEPKSWSDVRLPGRISGHCGTSGCISPIVEFYFVCGGHESTEKPEAIVLDLIKDNYRCVACLICAEEMSPVMVFPCHARHTMCLACFQQYCTYNLNNRSFLLSQDYGYTLPCPGHCERSLIVEPHHFRLLGNEQYERYQLYGAEECTLQRGGVLCPRPGCGAGMEVDANSRMVICGGKQGCGYMFCQECKEAYHSGACNSPENFPVNADNVAQSRWDIESLSLIRSQTKPCPNCRVNTERSGGCMHMTCSRCGYEWCWMCQEEWTRDCQARHWFG